MSAHQAGLDAAVQHVHEVQGRCGTFLAQLNDDGSPPWPDRGRVDVPLLVEEIVRTYLSTIDSTRNGRPT